MYTLSTYCKHGKRLVTVILAKTTSGIFNDRKTHQVIQQCYMYFGFVQFKNDFSPKPFYTLIHQNKTKIFILQSTKNTFIIMYLSSTNNNGYFFFKLECQMAKNSISNSIRCLLCKKKSLTILFFQQPSVLHPIHY